LRLKLYSLGNGGELPALVAAVAGPEANPVAVLSGYDPVAIVADLVQAARHTQGDGLAYE
jgi:hypothetical protein